MTTQQKNIILIAGAAIVLVAAGIAGGLAYSGFFSKADATPPQAIQAQPGEALPPQRIAVIEGARIMRDSKVGKDIQRQVEAYGKAAEADVNQRKSALQAEQKQLQQQESILSASAKAQKEKEFNAKVADFEKYSSNKEQLIQGGIYQAQQAVNEKMRDIMAALMKEHGATMLMDKGMFMSVAGNAEVTDEAISRLDAEMPTVKVELVPLPPEVLEAARRQQQQQALQAQQR